MTALLLACAAARADVADDLDDFFGNVNFVNVTAPGAYEGQAAGYYTGGGIFLRTPARNYTLFNPLWPRFNAGCGGIDLFAGGFSLIDSDELVGMLRNIGSAALGYAFMLALRTISPQISATIEQLQEWAQRFNLNNINSCEAARTLIGGALEHAGVQQSACILNRIERHGDTWAAARHNCSTGGRASDSLNEVQQDLQLEHVLARGNLAWRALMRNDVFRDDLELAQLVMNLTGTVIVQPQDPGNVERSPMEYRIVPGIFEQPAEAERLLEFMVAGNVGGGDPLLLWRCEPSPNLLLDLADQCTTLREDWTFTLTEDQSLRDRVAASLAAVSEKILDDRALTAGERALLTATRLPVYKYLTVRTAFLFNAEPAQYHLEYSTLIAKDLVVRYLEQLLGMAATAVPAGGGRETVRRFRMQVQTALSGLHRLDDRIGREFNAALRFNQETRLYEQALSTRLGQDFLRASVWQAANSGG